MEYVLYFVDVMLHLNNHLAGWIDSTGPWIYVILFLVIFAETGLVIFPFLPGDSLLFAVGALAGAGALSLTPLLLLLVVAAILGDAVNYLIGRKLGPQALSLPLIKKKHLEKTQAFYEKYGNKTIVLARFVPIVRTFAPFLAGVGQMEYRRFGLYNIAGGTVWITLFLCAGFFFGQQPLVKNNFSLVILGIICASVAPIFYEIIKARMKPTPSSVPTR